LGNQFIAGLANVLAVDDGASERSGNIAGLTAE
jgi:hypothetical protein